MLCIPATLDAAFDAEVRYPTEQLGERFGNYLDWMQPASIVSMRLELQGHGALLLRFLCPVLVLPCGFLEDGRGVGLQLVAPYGADAALLRAAAALEQRLALPAPEVPRWGRGELGTVGPRSASEAAAHHGLRERALHRALARSWKGCWRRPHGQALAACAWRASRRAGSPAAPGPSRRWSHGAPGGTGPGPGRSAAAAPQARRPQGAPSPCRLAPSRTWARPR